LLVENRLVIFLGHNLFVHSRKPSHRAAMVMAGMRLF
jgi:hypothetical protein